MNERELHTSAAPTVIEHLEDIPEFLSEEERAAFWDGHILSEVLWERVRQGDPELERRLTGVGEAEPESGAAIEFLGPDGRRSGGP